jgi:hypothetical protein
MEEKKEELTYTNDDGDTVYTSTYLSNRGTCCKSNCLHCPYGYTLKNHSIEIVDLTDKHIRFANEIVRDTMPVEQSELTSSLLAGAFGAKDKIRIHHITKTNFSNFAFGTLKGVVCAVIEFSNKLSESNSGSRPVKNLYLKKEFQNQGLGPEHITHSPQ